MIRIKSESSLMVLRCVFENIIIAWGNPQGRTRVREQLTLKSEWVGATHAFKLEPLKRESMGLTKRWWHEHTGQWEARDLVCINQGEAVWRQCGRAALVLTGETDSLLHHQLTDFSTDFGLVYPFTIRISFQNGMINSVNLESLICLFWVPVRG